MIVRSSSISCVSPDESSSQKSYNSSSVKQGSVSPAGAFATAAALRLQRVAVRGYLSSGHAVDRAVPMGSGRGLTRLHEGGL